MDFYLANATREDLALLSAAASIDMEIGTGTQNDFELTVPISVYDPAIYAAGVILYAPGTEYGGILDDPESSTSAEQITFTGDTFRGLLENKIICPPSGSAYRTISGELNACIRSLLGSQLGALFTVSAADTGVSVSNWQINRYVTLLDGITALLDSVGYRLQITAVEGETVSVQLAAVPVVDHSDEVEVSQDVGIDFAIKRYTRPYRYMIALGKGELESRTVLYLHLRDNGTVESLGRYDAIPNGVNVRVYRYDYPNAESVSDLLTAATEQFAEINGTQTQSVTISDEAADYELGDIVGGRDYITGMTVAQPITKKIIKYEGGILALDYQLGVDD